MRTHERPLLIDEFHFSDLILLPVLRRYRRIYYITRTPMVDAIRGRFRWCFGLGRDTQIVPCVPGDGVEGFEELDARTRVIVPDLLKEAHQEFSRTFGDQLRSDESRSHFVKGVCDSGGLYRLALEVTKLTEEFGEVDLLTLDFADLTDWNLLHAELIAIPAFLRWLHRRRILKVVRKKLETERRRREAAGETKQPPKGEYLLASEVGDASYAGKDLGQFAFLVDGLNVRPQDVLVYKSSQPMLYAEHENSFVELHPEFDFIDLRNTKYTKASMRDFLNRIEAMNHLVGCAPDFFYRLFLSLHEMAQLFDCRKIAWALHVNYTNDRRRIRMDSGVVTAVARRNNAKTISYQTRPYYLVDYFAAYDCVDVMLFWAPFWANESLAFSMIRERRYVGYYGLAADRERLKKGQVVAFSTDLATNNHNTISYNRRFVELVIECARMFPEREFVWKPKWPKQTDLLTRGLPAFPENFQIASEGLYSTQGLVDGASVVLCIGYTSPGFDALAQSCPTLFYSELGKATGRLGSLPAVAKSRTEFLEKVATLMSGDTEICDQSRDYLGMGQRLERSYVASLLNTISQRNEPEERT